MEIKDFVTVAVSATALIFSLVSTVMTLRLKRFEMQRTVRNQLSDIIKELVTAIAESGQLSIENEANRDEVYYHKFGALTQKTDSLVRQAVYLVEQEPTLVTDVEYGIIAQALRNAGNLPRAEDCWKKAIETSPSEFYKVVNTRGYANFLFGLGKYQLGRDQYQLALRLLDSNSDFNIFTNGYTYQMWLISEAVNFQMDEAERWYKQAKGTYESIRNSGLRDYALKGLEHVKIRFLSDSTPLSSPLKQVGSESSQINPTPVMPQLWAERN